MVAVGIDAVGDVVANSSVEHTFLVFFGEVLEDYFAEGLDDLQSIIGEGCEVFCYGFCFALHDLDSICQRDRPPCWFRVLLEVGIGG